MAGRSANNAMVSCKHCSTQNSLDSTFCKRCGTSLEETALAEAQTKLDGLIEEGNALFNQGRTEEAMAVAEACVLSNPSSVGALSLKVLCHERRGEIAEALECADRIVELNPDSELDKIKRNALRTRLQVDLRLPEPPDRRIAFVGAVSAVVLVACLGVGIARITSKPATENALAQNNPSLQQNLGATLNPAANLNLANQGGAGNGGATNPQAANPNPNPAQQTNPQTQQPGIGDVPALGNRNNDNGNGFRRPTNDIVLPTRSAGDGLPNANEPETRPVEPNVPEGLKIEPIQTPTNVTSKNSNGGNGGPDPDDIVVPTGNSVKSAAQPDDPDKGIEISVRSGGNGGGNRVPGGSAPVNNSNGLEMLQRVGTEQYTLGNYDAAARSYEQAVRQGGDAIVLNQRLGQSYARLGRNSDAAAAYRRCIEACDAAIASGRGNKARHESVKATAEQALKVLQGG